jgi:DNA-directed RNA polymerase subunit RPC12/RpoP
MSDKRPTVPYSLPDGRQNPEYLRQWKALNPERVKFNGRHGAWKTRGLNVKEAQAVYDSSSHCMICGVEVEGRNKHLDHDHKTNKLRGVLCENCNRGLGCFKDDPNLLRMASNYLVIQVE